MNIENGQEIAYNTSRNYPNSAAFIKFDRVAKVCKNGQIVLEGGRRFNSNGNELKSKVNNDFPSSRLMEVEYAREIIEQHKTNQDVRRLVQEVEDKMAGKRCGNGNYNLSAGQLAAMRALIASFDE